MKYRFWCLLLFNFIFLLFSLLFEQKVYSFESLSEYHGLTEIEQQRFEGPDLLSSEYQLDVFSYSKPTYMEYQWFTNEKAFDLTVGSLNVSKFYIDNRFKIKEFFGESFYFLFTYYEQGDLEVDNTHQVLELAYQPFSVLSFSFYGNPGLYKRTDDVGLAMTYRFADRHIIRIFHTYVDVPRQKRNDRNDYYITPNKPYAYGFTYIKGSPPELGSSIGDFIYAAFRYEPKVRWVFPDEKQEYQYDKTLFSIFFSKSVSSMLRITGRLQNDKKFEALYLDTIDAESDSVSTAGDDDTVWDTERTLSLVQLEFYKLGSDDNHSLITGVYSTQLEWKSLIEDFEMLDIIPHLKWIIPAYEQGSRQDNFTLGYQMAWHKESGDWSYDGSSLTSDIKQDHKLSLRYEFFFSSTCKFSLLINLDLDESVKRESWRRKNLQSIWDGGNGMFSYVF